MENTSGTSAIKVQSGQNCAMAMHVEALSQSIRLRRCLGPTMPARALFRLRMSRTT